MPHGRLLAPAYRLICDARGRLSRVNPLFTSRKPEANIILQLTDIVLLADLPRPRLSFIDLATTKSSGSSK